MSWVSKVFKVIWRILGRRAGDDGLLLQRSSPAWLVEGFLKKAEYALFGWRLESFLTDQVSIELQTVYPCEAVERELSIGNRAPHSGSTQVTFNTQSELHNHNQKRDFPLRNIADELRPIVVEGYER